MALIHDFQMMDHPTRIVKKPQLIWQCCRHVLRAVTQFWVVISIEQQCSSDGMVALHSADIVTHFVIRTQLSPISNGRLNCNRAARNTRAVHQNSQTEQVTKRLRRNRTHSTSAWCKCTLQVVIQNLLFLSAGFRESSDISLIATIVELSSLSPAGPLGARSDAITPKEIAELH